MSFEDDLNTPMERDWADVDLMVNGHLHRFRFTALDGLTWATECDRSPMRDDVGFDKAYGYDIRALTMRVAPLSGARVDGDALVPLRVDPFDEKHPNAPRVDEWADLFALIDGAAFRNISDTIWQLNEYLPQEAVKAAKKASAASAAHSNSPANSASPREGSGVGSRKKPRTTSTTTRGA